MLDRLIKECRARTKRFDPASALERKAIRTWGLAAGGVAVALLLYGAVAPRSLGTGVSLLFNPSTFVPAVGSAEIAYVRPGDASLIRGQEVRIETGTAEPVAVLSDAFVDIHSADGSKSRKQLLPLSPAEFALSLGAVDLPFAYLVEICGTQSQWFHVEVTERPSVKSLAVLYQYPRYTGLPHRVVENADGAVAGPYGTKVTLRVEATRPIAGGYLDFGNARADLLMTGDDYAREATFTLLEDGVYRVYITDPEGNPNDSSVPSAVKVAFDQPPAVAIPLPGRDVAAAPGSSFVVTVEVSDDYGAGAVELVVSDADAGSERVLKQWPGPMAKSATLQCEVHVDGSDFTVGRTYFLQAVARDNNFLTGPGEGRSPRYALKVIDEALARDETAKTLGALIERLRAVLAVQESARAAAEAGTELSSGVMESIKTAQVEIRDETASIAAACDAGVAAAADIRRILEGLVAGEMTEVIDLCDTALSAAGPTHDASAVRTTQDGIIDTLRKILGVLEALVEDVRSGRAAEGNELPSDVREQLRKLLDDLRQFVEDQKRIIEATNDLAALPVDDYTDDQLQRLTELVAAEEDWSNYLKEAHSDLSKLPKQDFSDPSMLSDIVETYSEIEMAAGALEKKAITVAVSREEVGLELAEELATHIEKWLPDTPDRLKWELEEPLEDIDAPMAELPTSLQDMIGDLMEQEEDIFSDIEDISSSYADSIDWGAGWDALDGPISNMSAQGVTGNALPNASEIAGRSGEGRTGRASGEFVGDTAVGKGGRRTPTRITPDDFVAGQVDDKSGQAAGGATGGGKEAGAGERGLQGPVPRQLSERISALAGRQAQIMSGAQKVDVSLRLAGYPNADMRAAIAAMGDTEHALRPGRLGNAIRQRPVLVTSLKAVTSVVGNEITIRRDNSLVLPKALQDDIIDGAGGRSPRGYDILLRSYYESLSTTKD